jgi:segregation and condensation protein B
MHYLIAKIEAVLFANAEPMTVEKLARICDASKAEVTAELQQLELRYGCDESGLVLLQLGNAYQIATKTQYASYIKAAIEIKRQTPLSPAAMEVLAIIAYNQPVSKAFIEQVRGIDSSSVVNTLYERGLVEEAGRLNLPGRPIAYRTTDNFLRCFGLKKLSELPPLPGEEEQLTFDEEKS